MSSAARRQRTSAWAMKPAFMTDWVPPKTASMPVCMPMEQAAKPVVVAWVRASAAAVDMSLVAAMVAASSWRPAASCSRLARRWCHRGTVKTPATSVLADPPGCFRARSWPSWESMVVFSVPAAVASSG